MRLSLNVVPCATLGALAAFAVAFIWAAPPVALAAADGIMPPAQQNMLIRQYCVVCHDDRHMNGGLSLEHFDTASPDPVTTAMVLAKIRDAGAMGAAGIPKPDAFTQVALIRALTTEAAGAMEWKVDTTQPPIAPMLTASIVREARSPRQAFPDLYRLTMTCRPDTHEGTMQVAWSPGGPPADRAFTVAVDGHAPVPYHVGGPERMGNGGRSISGPGAVELFAAARDSDAAPTPVRVLPADTLTISDVLPGETVVFPVGELNTATRQALTACFGQPRAHR